MRRAFGRRGSTGQSLGRSPEASTAPRRSSVRAARTERGPRVTAGFTGAGRSRCSDRELRRGTVQSLSAPLGQRHDVVAGSTETMRVARRGSLRSTPRRGTARAPQQEGTLGIRHESQRPWPRAAVPLAARPGVAAGPGTPRTWGRNKLPKRRRIHRQQPGPRHRWPALNDAVSLGAART